MKKILIIIGIIIVILSCSKKDNMVGFNILNQPKKLTINNNIVKYKTIEDTIRNYSENDILLVGKWNNREIRTLVKFNNLPDSVSNVSKSVIIFAILGNNNFNEDAIELGRLTSNWNENETTWTKAYTDTLWDEEGADFTSLQVDSINIKDDSLYIKIPTDSVEYWINNQIEFSIILTYSSGEDSTFLQLQSSEGDIKPTLQLQYAVDDTSESMEKNPSQDSFIMDNKNSLSFSDNIKISNLIPTQSLIKLEISDTLFEMTEEELLYITINKAELILTKKEGELFSESINIFPYNLKASYDWSSQPNIGEDYEILAKTVSSTLSNDSDTLRLDITPLVQAWTSNKFDNNGFLIKSTSCNKDLSYVVFDTTNSRFEVTYTPKMLK